MTLGEKLQAVRKEQGLTLQQVADAAGLSKAFVSQIESGTANPSLASLKRVGNALEHPAGRALRGRDERRRAPAALGRGGR